MAVALFFNLDSIYIDVYFATILLKIIYFCISVYFTIIKLKRKRVWLQFDIQSWYSKKKKKKNSPADIILNVENVQYSL